jgi:hypothetical protein
VGPGKLKLRGFQSDRDETNETILLQILFSNVSCMVCSFAEKIVWLLVNIQTIITTPYTFSALLVSVTIVVQPPAWKFVNTSVKRSYVAR